MNPIAGIKIATSVKRVTAATAILLHVGPCVAVAAIFRTRGEACDPERLGAANGSEVGHVADMHLGHGGCLGIEVRDELLRFRLSLVYGEEHVLQSHSSCSMKPS